MNTSVCDSNIERAKNQIALLPSQVGEPLLGLLNDVQELYCQLDRLKYSIEDEFASAQLTAAYERFDCQATANEAVQHGRR